MFFPRLSTSFYDEGQDRTTGSEEEIFPALFQLANHKPRWNCTVLFCVGLQLDLTLLSRDQSS